MKKESTSSRLQPRRFVCAVSAVFAAVILGTPAPVGAASPPPLQPGVQSAQDFTPTHTSYVVTNATPLYHTPAYGTDNTTGEILQRGARPEILGEANAGLYLLVKLRDRYTDSPSVVAACHAHNASIPRCVAYRNFAEVWFNLRTQNPSLLAYQPQVIDHLGTGNDEASIDQSPEFRDRLQHLLSATMSADRTKWPNGKAWGDVMYARCMAGQFS